MKTPAPTVMIAALLCLNAAPGQPAGALTLGQWTPGRAWAWHQAQPWLVGCNFLPSTAVNDVEMWRKESFDAKTIDRELGWARELGFNSVRVFLNFVVWREDAAGLKQQLDEFLKIADRHGISVMPILFDDCNFAGRVAAAGPQPAPVPGVHNSQWVSSPPLAMVADRAAWPTLELYVKDLVGAFARDRRIVVWDLYNEPGNGMGEKSRPLVEAAFAWAREMKPAQPLTVGAWADFNSPFSRRLMELSDVVSFHAYDGLAGTEAKVRICREYGRPVLCTEWMARGHGSRFETHLPFFKTNQIGCYNWGLVAGRTQTHFPWGSPQGAPEPKLWHHDILRADGTAFKAREVEFIKVTTGQLPASALPQRKMLVPTAEKGPVTWRYTLGKPADDWFKPAFNDSAWKQGDAPFGTLEPPFGRQPNTAWTGADLWLRREFEMPPGQFSELALLLHHDEDTEVYLNGVLAVKAGGFNAAYEPFDIAPEAQAALRSGRNTLAAHCRQTGGGQYLDVGLEGVAAKPAMDQASADDSTYRGWKTLALRNGLVELQVLPEIGGRIIQFRLGGKEFLWTHPQLAGLLPPSNGLAADGGWFNVGGDKLWPAPQGWDNDRQWPGPPDAVLDGQPHTLEKLRARNGETAVRLTSGKDPRSGIQFSRVIRLFEGSTRVSFEATMKNVDTQPRRWGIWAHTQLDGAKADGSSHNPLMQAWCPLNPQSKFARGYEVIFGAKDNPSFQPDAKRGLMHVKYQYQVGKIGLDSHAGWVVTVDGANGAVFVQRFVFEPEKEYPDGSSVEFWLNGLGQIRAYNKDMIMPTNAAENPYVFESEVLSPFAKLEPGESYTWRYDWYACNLGGDFPVVTCTDAGVVAEPLVATLSGNTLQLRGRFGVFAPGGLEAAIQDALGRTVARQRLPGRVTPLMATTVQADLHVPASASSVTLHVFDENGRPLGELARCSIPQSSVDWAMGPFVKHPKPVLSPTPDSQFQCPILGNEVRWEEQNVYNPAAVVRDGKVFLFYRADDKNPGLKWGRTCRIGMAWSEDGTNFTRHPTPVLYPDNDEWKKLEWEGGCEDLHIVEGEDGVCYMNYTTWDGHSDTVSIASSRDLFHWKKHGPAFAKAGKIGGRSGVVVSRLVGDRLLAAKIDGKYWMYYTHPCALAWSTNLTDWTPTGHAVWPGGGREAGAIALLRDEGILLMTQGGHSSLGAWVLRQALIDRRDLQRVVQEQKEPFLFPEYAWEKHGFTGATTVANTLVPFKGQWLLYYGGADRHVGLAVFSPKTGSSYSLGARNR